VQGSVHVGTAALGCPVERSSTDAASDPDLDLGTNQALWKDASLRSAGQPMRLSPHILSKRSMPL
jgi:hypothetical protein